MRKRTRRAMPVVPCVLLVLWSVLSGGSALPDQGKWDFLMTQEQPTFALPKSLLAGSKIFVQITCDAVNTNTDIEISWFLSESKCWVGEGTERFNQSARTNVQKEKFQCKHDGHIILDELKLTEVPSKLPQEGGDATAPVAPVAPVVNGLRQPVEHPVIEIHHDGIYIFQMTITPVPAQNAFQANVHIEIRATYGYLSAIDYPLLLFYGIMCLIYVAFGALWLLVSFLQWRDLLRIQFWIGGVIFLGMLEKAMFYAEYQSINTSGVSIRGVVLLAEWVSCAKRTLARMLVIIVSLGFGIVKPRLGPMLHRVVGTGALYFVLACVESYLRVVHVKNDPNNQNLVASIPLAVLDSAICWWIFNSLVQTTRTLRLRRNTVKLALYRHFTNTLIFAVIASVIFMLYSIKTRRLNECFQDWKELWVDEAFWHVLFSMLLLVIMVLWRPTNNNQRYAFTPLLDNPEDEDEDDDSEDGEEDQFISDAYGVKMRGQPRSQSPKLMATQNDDEDLKWVEENIPAAIADAALPIIDSDEEIVNTRFEVSKMQ